MIIKNGDIVTPYEIIRNTDLKTKNGKIADIGNFDSSCDEVFDASGCYVCPGFVDIHTHGGGGGDFMDADENAFDKALAFHAANGTTSLLATSVTAPVGQIEDMLNLVKNYMNHSEPSCRIWGAHIEGPYISLKNKGAQHENYLRIPARDNYSFITKNSDIIKTVTIAPELDGAIQMTKDLRKHGIVVCGGHDDGERDNILPVINAGLSHCTHLWCAMSTVAMRNHVRNVGLCELGLVDDRLTVELIADNHHITPDMVRLVYKCKGAEKMCIVSDCLRAGGMPCDGTLYSLGSSKDANAQRFIVSDGVARLPDNTRYAGSIQPLSQMVKNLVNNCNIPLVDAIRMASLTPARIIGINKFVGSIKPEKYADLCILDRNLNVVATITNEKKLQ